MPKPCFTLLMYARPLSHLTARSTAAVVAALAVAAGAPATASALTISGTSVKTLPESTNSTRANDRTTDIVYYLDLHAGPTDERFSVKLDPPAFATEGSADEGAAIDGPLQFGLYGPGSVGTVLTDPAFAPLCSERDNFHGYATGSSTADVFLPAGADTTLAIRYAVGRKAPWADTDLRLRFSFASQLFGTYGPGSPLLGPATSVAGAGTHTQTQQVEVRPSGRDGRKGKIGAHLILKTTPKGTYGEDGGKARTISSKTRVRVRGELLPKTKGKRVLLQWAKPGKKLRTAARVTTDKRGRFAATLKAPGRGEYELWASYPKQPGPLTADRTSCPVRFKVK